MAKPFAISIRNSLPKILVILLMLYLVFLNHCGGDLVSAESVFTFHSRFFICVLQISVYWNNVFCDIEKKKRVMSRRPGNPTRRFGDNGGGLFSSKSRSPPVLSIALVIVVRFFFWCWFNAVISLWGRFLLIDLALATLY